LYGTRQRIGLALGPAALIIILLLPLPDGMSPAARKVAAVAVLMAVWWITEAAPLAATALLPAALFPAMGVMKASEATAPYANHLIFLFLGGFFIAVTMEKWNLHKRIALFTIRLVGTGTDRIILGFMIATAFLSMWISNTATAMMMVPIGMAVIRQVTSCDTYGGENGTVRGTAATGFGAALMLSIAYSASIGGVATLIGTPPNVIFAGFIESTFGRSVSFLSWMSVGLPLAVVMLACTWFYLTRFVFRLGSKEVPGGLACIEEESRGLGPVSPAEKKIMAVFLLVAAGWILRGLVNIPGAGMTADSTIAIIGALILFLLPADFRSGEFLLDWKTASKVPWDVIILFGGGLSLAAGFRVSGLDRWIGESISILQGVNYMVLISAVAFLTIFLTEVTSNTATSAMLIPIISGVAISMSIHPYGPIAAVCIAASYAFMLPVATPPNAVVFGSRQVTITQMVRAGLVLNIFGWIVITLVVSLLLPILWGIDPAGLPAWAGK
jgi:sodium-dependent dicarboxylate transporter 2/3/5